MISLLHRIAEHGLGAPLHLQIGGHEVAAIPTAVLVFTIGLIHVVAWARLAQRAMRVRFNSTVGSSVYLAMGYAAFGFYIWILGYLHLLFPAAMQVSACVFAALTLADRGWRAGLHHHLRAVRDGARAWPIATTIICLVAALALVSGLRDIHFIEDWDYHWQSPLVWSAARHWVASPYRLSNGPALSEMINTLAAMFASPTGGNWLASLFWIICALCIAALIEPLGVPTPLVLLATFATPIFLGDASSMNSDVPATCFALAAFVFLLRAAAWETAVPADSGERTRAVLGAGIMLAAVYATKFIVLGCLPAAIALTICQSPRGLPAKFRGLLWLAAPLVLVFALGVLHTYHMIGQPFDNSGKFMASSENDWRYRVGLAAGRVPTVHQLLRLPIEPWVTTLWGKREPYGGRTGVMWAVMLPVAIYLAWRGKMRRGYLFALLAVAASTFLIIGAVSLKTRFVMVAFLTLAVVGAAAYAHRGSLHPAARKLLTVAFILCCGLDISFGCRKLLLGVVLEMPRGQLVAGDSVRHPGVDFEKIEVSRAN